MNAVVTGASKGIGKAICLKLAEEGFDLAVCSRSQDNMERLAEELKDSHPNCSVLAMKCDVSDKGQVQDFAAEVAAQVKGAD